MELIDISEVSAMLGISPKSIGRMVKRKAMPLPVAIGRLRRWNKAIIEAWIAKGCPNSATLRGLGRRQIFA